MRKVIGTLLAIALVTGVALVANRPGPAGAQGGGTIEATVTYAGAPVVEKLKVNKDTEKCGTEKFEKPEMIKLTCDVHSWMLGWVAVMPNPFFGVTGGDGTAKIENVPPGKYTVEAWHETLGKQTKEVEVKAGQATKVAIEMKK